MFVNSYFTRAELKDLFQLDHPEVSDTQIQLSIIGDTIASEFCRGEHLDMDNHRDRILQRLVKEGGPESAMSSSTCGPNGVKLTPELRKHFEYLKHLSTCYKTTPHMFAFLTRVAADIFGLSDNGFVVDKQSGDQAPIDEDKVRALAEAATEALKDSRGLGSPEPECTTLRFSLLV